VPEAMAVLLDRKVQGKIIITMDEGLGSEGGTGPVTSAGRQLQSRL
jgi:hypothetical protein